MNTALHTEDLRTFDLVVKGVLRMSMVNYPAREAQDVCLRGSAVNRSSRAQELPCEPFLPHID